MQEANKYTGDDPGVGVKNLFLKVANTCIYCNKHAAQQHSCPISSQAFIVQDKKNRLFLVAAEASTKVDLKGLSPVQNCCRPNSHLT